MNVKEEEVVVVVAIIKIINDENNNNNCHPHHHHHSPVFPLKLAINPLPSAPPRLFSKSSNSARNATQHTNT
jgi:hypothetical protein